MSKKHRFKFKFWDNDNSVYFAFAITMAYFSTKAFSFGLEIAGVRIVFFEYKRLLPSSNDKADVYVGEINYKPAPLEVPQSTMDEWEWK